MKFADSLFERARHYVSKRRCRRLGEELGLPVAHQSNLTTLEMIASIKAHLRGKVDVLVDIGAHKGAFALPAAHALGADTTICFEPNPQMAAVLVEKLTQINGMLILSALASRPGVRTFHVHQDASMSSLMAGNDDVLRQEFASYDTGNIRDLEISVSTLDLELAEYREAGRRFFLKLDTQGNELEILRGSTETLAVCDGLVTEYMFTTPYIGQASFWELHEFLCRRGFLCAGVMDVKRRATHRVSGVDFLFLPAVDD